MMFPKRTRIVDPAARRRYLQDHPRCEIGGDCEHFGWPNGAGAHHIVSRGQQGDDTDANLITLCNKHHSLVHQGKIDAEFLLACKVGRGVQWN